MHSAAAARRISPKAMPANIRNYAYPGAETYINYGFIYPFSL
jgi:hypothetical protein